jgi:ATP-dependent exoDNAse (exonuclease V) beta subunit
VAGVVRVMTIHKSKGLGFDVVVLPDLEGQRIDQRRSGLAVQRAEDRTVEWVLELPPKLFHAQDETLSAHVRDAEADACYEAFSLLYVAMTRAKRAMYLITKPVGTSESRNYPKILAATLGGESGEVRIGALTCAGAWSNGDPSWHRALTSLLEAATAAESFSVLDAAIVARAPRRIARRPSGAKAGFLRASQLFGLEGGAAAKFGTGVHELLSNVEWGTASEIARFAAQWKEAGPEGMEALACLRAPALGDVWRPRENAEVWRERPFEIVLEGVWLTGVFDRVVLERIGGSAQRVTVFDFKTDRIGSADAIDAAVARHAAQLNEYRRIAAVLAGVPESAVRCELVFTQSQQRVVVPPG